MDKLDQLWIRACKSKNPYKRVLTLHRRFYGAYEGNELANKVVVSGLIAEIVDKYAPMTSFELLTKMNHSYFFDREETIREKSFEVMVNHIRNSKKSKFEGLTTPLSFRIKYKEKIHE